MSDDSIIMVQKRCHYEWVAGKQRLDFINTEQKYAVTRNPRKNDSPDQKKTRDSPYRESLVLVSVIHLLYLRRLLAISAKLISIVM